ncbi:hypothetical protein BH11VER1_BH11VER1_24650 [soil metagenome]
MNGPIQWQLINLGFQLCVAGLVWHYYRKSLLSLGYKYDTFGPRFWTGSIDGCVLWPASFILSMLATIKLPPVMFMALVIAESLVWLAYTVVMHSKYGQTYGKMVCKIRVVDYKTEEAISFKQALLRESIPVMITLGIVGYEGYLILSGEMTQDALIRGEYISRAPFQVLILLPLLWFVAEALTMLTNEKRRALHDYIAGTVVVRTNVS